MWHLTSIYLEYSKLLRHIYIFCLLILPMEIAYIICLKVPLTLNFKILSVETFSLILLVTYYAHTIQYICPLLRLFLSTTSFRDSGCRACFGKTKDSPWLSKKIQWNFYSIMPSLIRLYDVYIKKKLSGISVSFIIFFIAILCYNLSFHDVLRSPVCYTC